MKESLRIGVLLAVVALVYVNTLRNEFTMDDGIYILLNPQVTHASVRALFAPHEVSNVFGAHQQERQKDHRGFL